MSIDAIEPVFSKPSTSADVSNALIGDIWTRPVSFEQPQQQQDQQQELPPAPTQEQIREMQSEAVQGRLNDTAAAMLVRGLITAGGPQGLSQVRNDLNQHLEQQNSEYRARIARVDSGNGEINFYMVLQRNNENLNDIVRDVHENGRNSQYSARAIRIQLTPQGQGGGGGGGRIV